MKKGILFVLLAFFSFLSAALPVPLQASKTEQSLGCSPSCGNLNISYPFRIKGDPPNCGDSTYQLSCEGDQPYFYLLERKYAVIAIEYKTGMIRVIDYELQQQRGKCPSNFSSFPYLLPYFPWLHAYILFKSDIVTSFKSDIVTLSTSTSLHCGTYVLPESYGSITYLNCSSPIDHVTFIPANSCFNATSSSVHIYAVLLSPASISDLPPPCKIVATANVLKSALTKAEKYEYTQVHEMLMRGFELSWGAPLACKRLETEGLNCTIYPNLEVSCHGYDHGWKYQIISFFRLVFGSIRNSSFPWFLFKCRTDSDWFPCSVFTEGFEWEAYVYMFRKAFF